MMSDNFGKGRGNGSVERSTNQAGYNGSGDKSGNKPNNSKIEDVKNWTKDAVHNVTKK